MLHSKGPYWASMRRVSLMDNFNITGDALELPGDAGRRLAQPTTTQRPVTLVAQAPCCRCNQMREVDDRPCVHCGAIPCEG